MALGDLLLWQTMRSFSYPPEFRFVGLNLYPGNCNKWPMAEWIEGQLRSQWKGVSPQLRSERQQLRMTQSPHQPMDKIQIEWNRRIAQVQEYFAKKD
jgi:hypothetical protein